MQQEGNTHAIWSPSGAAAWSRCIGKPAMEYGLPDSRSEYADEGTAAHFLAATCLLEGGDPARYLKRQIAIWSHPESNSEGADFVGNVTAPELVIRNVFDVDSEMVGAVRKYVQAVQRYAEGGSLEVECKLPIDHITEEEGATGTSDAVIIRLSMVENELQVHDLKYGQGEEVFAEHNEQLAMYALAALRKAQLVADFDTVRLFIHQPRVRSEPDEWRLTVAELEAIRDNLNSRARLSRLAFENRANWINGPDYSYLSAGDIQCKYCKAKHECPTLNTYVQESVGAQFEVIAAGETPISTDEGMAANIAAATDEAIGMKLSTCDLIEKWIKAVRAEAERRMFAGHTVPGYKVVQGRQGNRAWSDEDEALRLLKSFRLKQEQIFDFKLISPTSAEKLMESGAISDKQWSKLEKVVSRSPGKPSVAPESDKRPAIALSSSAEDFDHKPVSVESLL